MALLITLTTDFGEGSPYVAIMKGVILSINPEARIVDVSHAVGPQNIRAGAIVLADVTRWFPPDAIHVAVVDPGVGTSRRLIYAEIGGRRYLAPDNGLLSRLALGSPPSTIVNLTNRQWWLAEVSATFHGRDILAPVAARLSLGLDPQRLGEPTSEFVQLDWPEAIVGAAKIDGVVESIDSFGNLVTNVTADQLSGVPRGEETLIVCDEHETRGIFHDYEDQPEMTLIALVGSSGKLELAIVDDSAAVMLGVRPGAPVRVTW